MAFSCYDEYLTIDGERNTADEPRDSEAAPRSSQREVEARTADGGGPPRGDERSTTTAKSEAPNENESLKRRPTSDFRISTILGETSKIMEEKGTNEVNARGAGEPLDAEEGNLMIDLAAADNG